MATASTTQERAAELNVLARKQRSLWGDAVYRLFRNKAAVGGLIVIIAAFLVAAFSGVIAPYNPIEIPASSNLASQMEPLWTGSKYTDSRYLLGTDFLGRDILSRLMYASRISMIVGFIPTSIVFLVGVTVASLGLMGGVLVELAGTAFTDVFTVLLGIAALAVLLRSRVNTAWLVAAGVGIGVIHAVVA